MKITNLLAIALPLAILVSSCDRGTPTEPDSNTDQLMVHPRLLAASPLPGARIELRLQRRGIADLVVDTLYSSGSTLRLGTVANGDSFAVRARGYDSINGSRKYLWSGIVQSLAMGGHDNIQLVDVPVEFAPAPSGKIEIADDPTIVVIPRGLWYTTDSSDPRLLTPGKVSMSDSDLVAKEGTIRMSGMKISTSGDTLWSPVVTLMYGRSETGDSLVGTWWEDDTTTSGVRSLYLDSLGADGSIKRIPYDTIRLEPLSGGVVQAGTWRARDGVLRWFFDNDTSTWSIAVRRIGDGYTMQFANRPMRGRLANTRPAASDTTPIDTGRVDSTPKVLRDSLNGIWWEDYRGADGYRIVYLDSLNENGTFSTSVLDSATMQLRHFSSGTWSAIHDSITFVYTGGSDNDFAAITRSVGGFTLNYATGGSSTWSKTQPTFEKPLVQSFVAMYWEDDTVAGIRRIFLDSIFSDSTFKRISYDTFTLTSGDATGGNWSSRNGGFVLVLSSTAGDTIRLDTTTSTVSGSGVSGKLGTSKPVASKKPSPLAGIWWEIYDGWAVYYCDTIKQDGSYTAVEYDTATGNATGTTFAGTWILDESDSSITFQLSASSSDSARITATAEGYRLAYHSGSSSTLSKTRPVPSSTGSPDTTWNLASREILSGTWWFDTTFVTSADDTIPVAIRYDLSADGSGAGRRTIFVTWLDSLSDTPITYDATSDLVKVMNGDSTMVSKYTTTGNNDSLYFTDGSNRLWTKTRPVLCDPAMVGTWMSANDSLILSASSKAEWYWTSSRTLYPYTWSTRAGKIFFFQPDEAEPTYRYVYSPGSTSVILDGDEKFELIP
jgi:hypothetical protein